LGVSIFIETNTSRPIVAEQKEIDQQFSVWIDFVPHKVVQQPAAKELKKSPKIPFVGLILSPDAS
jgi:hypothetical protein